MKLTQKSIVSLLGGLFVSGLGAAAQAQDSPPPASSPPPAATSYSGGGGGGAGIGVGISQTVMLGGPGGGALGQFVYDVAMFHLEGLLGFNSVEVGPDDRETTFVFGAGGWYHLARGSSSDFSLGGVIAVNTVSGPGASDTLTSLEPGALIRAFITPNVALFGRGGIGFLLGDTTQIALRGQAYSAFGVTYFFR